MSTFPQDCSLSWVPAAALALTMTLAPFSRIVLAQTQPPVKESANQDPLKQHDRELEATRAEQKKAAENAQKLRTEIEELGEDRRKLNQSLLDTAARVRDTETRSSASETRLISLEGEEQALHRSLDDRQAIIAEVLAALQRIGRRPPPALITNPEDALRSLRTAIVLGAVLPEMRDKAKALASEITELLRIRNRMVVEKTQFSQELAALAAEHQRMTLLIEERQRKQAKIEKALETERQRAAALARQVDNLKELIVRLEQDLDGPARAARLATRQADDHNLDSRTSMAALKDPGRLSPALAFVSTRGLLRLPANGVKIRNFGASDGFGGTEKGISIATRAGAQVISPNDGWVVYAGPFRSYGQLLILNAGSGYHIVLAGMDKIFVDIGQFVLNGEPVAVMGGGSQMAANLPTGSSQPVLYIEFRKDGVPVDSSPWWATSESEKVRG